MEGVFVYTSQSTETVKFVPVDGGKSANNNGKIVLNLRGGEGNVVDRVIVRMNECEALPKYTFNEANAHISIPQDGDEYAVVNGSDAEMFTLNFRTENISTYTISANVDGVDIDYLHLIDNIEGVDVDMLLEGSYTFAGAPDDMTGRFTVRFSAAGCDNVNEIFAYQNGSDIIVDGEGTLEVYDMMGRFVGSQVVNGVETIQALPMGVYILRLVGDNVMTQKIIVR